MGKILGLDLGTNSIGWIIRETEITNGSQFIDKGVIVFKKGVGDGKSGEFSLPAERRKHRGKRRLYNAKRYRKWATLEVLIQNNMCPLSIEELNLWRVGEWKEVNGQKKNLGRKYPASSNFISWLKMDFNNDSKCDFVNPYELRCSLIEVFDEKDKYRLCKIGRVMYHLAQRRGFKTNRKSGKSAYGENEYFKYFHAKHPDKQDWTASKIWLYLLSQADEDEKLRINRIRSSGVIQRDEYEKEFYKLCEKQSLNTTLTDLTEKLHNAIYHVRPLRSQKGLVGKCTYETDKPRIPVSHPSFEEFRALQFINNIKWKLSDSKDNLEPIPINLKKKIFEELYFRKSKKHFKFEEIVSRYSENSKYEFNYKNNPSVSACPVITGLINVFENEWKNIFIDDENAFGINWNGLSLNYKTKQYGKDKIVKLDYEGLWHLLFDYLQTKDDENGLVTFAKEKFGWAEDKAKIFAKIDIQQGYGSLSKSAINKIVPYLKKGLIYTEAVVFANLEQVLGKEKFEENKDKVFLEIRKTIEIIKDEKNKLNIINGLIQKFFANKEYRQNKNYSLTDDDKKEIQERLISDFGEKGWTDLTDGERNKYLNFITNKYLEFMQGKQSNEDKASFKTGERPPQYDYYKLPRQDEAIKKMLRDEFNVTDSMLNHLYHPSDIEIYPEAIEKEIIANGQAIRVKQLGSPQPPTKGFKNPMAMRTLYELKKLLNYLLATNKIDENTRIVIELARKLNDANYRKAYTDWINDRDEENKEHAKAITERPWNINSPSEDDYNKFQSAVEQLDNLEFSENKSEEFKQKYNEFIETYLVTNDDSIDEFDYMMYLILSRDEFVRMLNFSPPGTNKWVTQLINTSRGFREKRKVLKDILIKYRLWKDQKFQCLYTGRVIPLKDLFNATKCQIEHTIPRSTSFDSELKNLTVCDTVYNNNEKKKQFPTQCSNYTESKKCKTIEGDKECSPIINRVNDIIKPKVEELEKRISNLKAAAKDIPDWKIDKKNANIRLRHYLNFELQYWKQKLFTFTVERNNWKDKFKNSQLVDTQIVTKYARAYLKSLFKRVDVQKASIVHTFREEIYELPEKSRDNHSHHAIDAAVLTLIPGSANRDKQMKEYFEWKEGKNNEYYRVKPYPAFETKHIKEDIENNVIINHTFKDSALTPTRKFARKRGKVEYIRDKKTGKYLLDNNGKRISKILQGDSIRGQLHKESFFGAIKVNERNKDGFPIKQNSKYLVKQKNNEDEIWIVCRKDIKDVDFSQDIIIDELLKKHITQQLEKGIKQIELVDFNNKPIRHIRCRYKAGIGFLSKEKAIPIKEHLFKSKYEHKQNYLAQNEGNYLYLLYEGKDKNDKIIRGYRIINLFDIAQLNLKNIEHLKNEKEYMNLQKKKGKNVIELELKNILKVGARIILYKNNRDEITNHNANNRLFYIYKFNEVASTGYIYAQFHKEARTNEELGDGDISFYPDKYQARLKLRPDEFNCLIESNDFEIKPDGEVILF